MAGTAHRGWSGALLSDDELVKEGVWRDDESTNSVDQPVRGGGIGVHNQLGVLPATNVLNRLSRLISDDQR